MDPKLSSLARNGNKSDVPSDALAMVTTQNGKQLPLSLTKGNYVNQTWLEKLRERQYRWKNLPPVLLSHTVQKSVPFHPNQFKSTKLALMTNEELRYARTNYGFLTLVAAKFQIAGNVPKTTKGTIAAALIDNRMRRREERMIASFSAPVNRNASVAVVVPNYSISLKENLNSVWSVSAGTVDVDMEDSTYPFTISYSLLLICSSDRFVRNRFDQICEQVGAAADSHTSIIAQLEDLSDSVEDEEEKLSEEVSESVRVALDSEVPQPEGTFSRIAARPLRLQ